MLILARLREHPRAVRNHESLLIAALPARSGAAAPWAAALAPVCGQLAGAGTGEGFWLEQGAVLQTDDSVLSPDVLAVFEFYYREEAVLTRRLTQTLGAIGDEFGEFLSHRRGPLHPPLLSAREVEVLQSAADGYSGPEIAGRLSVAPATIASHMQHIYERLGVSNRGAAVAVAIRSGVIA